MNILQIVPNPGWGGGEQYVWELSHALAEAGHHVRVIIHPDDIQRKRFADLQPVRLTFRGPYDWRAICHLARLVQQYQIEVIHTHLFKHATAALLARRWFRLKVKVVMTRHLCRPAKRKLHYPWLYRHIDRLIFISNKALETFLSSGPKIAPSRLAVVPNSVRDEEPTTTPLPNLRSQLQLDPTRFLIGFAGTLTPIKGVEFILDLAERLKTVAPDIAFVLAGKTPEGRASYLDYLHQEVERRHLQHQVYFLGFIHHTIAFFRQVDAVIVPTLTTEPFGLVVLEGMVARRPILFSEHILEEVITPDEGLRIPTYDVERCCQAILALRHDPQRCELLAERGYQKWQRCFTYERFLARILQIYQD